MPRRHPIMIRIDEAVALHREWGREVTLESVREYVRHSIRHADFTSDEAVDAVIDQRLAPRLKQLGFVISDAQAGERLQLWDCTLDEFDEQIRIKQENKTYITNSLKADEAVRKFLTAKQALSAAPITVGDFADDVNRIYAEFGLRRGQALEEAA